MAVCEIPDNIIAKAKERLMVLGGFKDDEVTERMAVATILNAQMLVQSLGGKVEWPNEEVA